MKDLADIVRGITEFKQMMESGDEQSPLSALGDIARTLASIYEQLRLLNINLTEFNRINGVTLSAGEVKQNGGTLDA